MANEGMLGKFTLTGEKAATDNHPVIIHVLPLAKGVTEQLTPGTILKRVKEDDSYVYGIWVSGDSESPKAVVNEPCDPSVEASAKAVIHGCVKTQLLVENGGADATAFVKLSDTGIFAV